MVSWKTNIRPLFTDLNRGCMLRARKPQPNRLAEDVSFDLHLFDAVREHADKILLEVTSGNMPRDDGPRWDIDKVRLFAQWMMAGMPDN
ncbi:MAG: hypothetical protein PHE17_09420 [Thiothrix sp.]|uniref:hypothetical protein n=1 Tax=Thiothrix sp. TaxID=1032 RepID=UPI00261FD36E|nr:hypothetical protein [Thiothrix sp.]MDD5393225.1 hypothetical protein [Thiothrix sp.]